MQIAAPQKSEILLLLIVQTSKYLFKQGCDTGRNILPDFLFFILNFQEHTIQGFIGKIVVEISIYGMNPASFPGNGVGKQIPFSRQCIP